MDLTFIFHSYPIPEFQELNYTHSSKFYLLYCVVVSAARKVGVILYYLAKKKLIFYANIILLKMGGLPLDVVFNEDLSRVHKEHAGENMAIVRHIVLNMLNQAKSTFKGVGLKALRKKAGWGIIHCHTF